MKILVLGSRIPYPLHDGGAIATFNMLSELAAQGQEITYFSYNTRKHFVSQQGIDENFNFCRIISTYLNAETTWYGALWGLISGKNYNISRFINKEANLALASLLQKETFDIIHFEGLYSVPFYEVVKAMAPATPVVLRQHNVEYMIWGNLADIEKNPLKKWYLKKLTAGLRKYEVDTLMKFKNIVAITRQDAVVFSQINNNADVFYYPAGFRFKENINAAAEPNTLYHIGSMEWMPNVEGVKWFCTEVMPGLLEKLPKVRLHIAGKGLKQDDPQYEFQGVVNHGEVEDAAAFHARFGIMVVPLHSGSGLRMKTLEAMSLTRPVVSTSLGAEGIPFTQGENLLIADTSEDWISTLTSLLGDDARQKSLGMAGKALVTDTFSVAAHTAELIQYYRQILSRRT